MERTLQLSANESPIESKQQLIDYVDSGCKPEDQWRIGTEHEKFGFNLQTLQPLPYEGPAGIQAMLEGLQRFAWQPVVEAGKVIMLTLPDGCSVTLEPGGQLELSGAKLETIHQTCDEVATHLAQVREVSNEIGVGFLGLGFHPLARREEVSWMPKARYEIMRRYMPTVGQHGVDMMIRTCTVQVNLDYRSEADMVKKFRVSLALQPLATALFANSPFTEGKPNGYLSYRSEVWTDTDPNRSGMLPFVFESGMGFERWVDYMLDVPMYFVYRDHRYIDAAGQSFRDFMVGKLPALPGHLPNIQDWENHLTTVFPEVRLKKFLEMRGADGGPWAQLCALPAFWVGLLYDSNALDAAWDLVSSWTESDREQLRQDVTKLGLKAEIGGRSLQTIAAKVMEIATSGLQNRARLNAAGDNETGFLAPLLEIVQSGVTPAEHKLRLFQTEWDHKIEPVFKIFAY